MSKTRTESDHTVRPSAPPKVPVVCCALLCLITAAGVYWAQTSADRRSASAETYASTATVYQKSGFPVVETDGETPTPAEPDCRAICDLLLSQPNVYRTVRRVGPSLESADGESPQQTAQRSAESLRQQLDVTADWTSTPGEMGISIAYTAADPEYAAAVVNALAEAYVADCMTQWKTRVRQAHDEAQAALNDATYERIEARARRDAFIAEHVELAKTQEPSAPPREASLVANPRWKELVAQLDELTQRRRTMLVDRQQEHPAVQALDLQIDALRRRMDGVERKVPRESLDPSEVPPEEPAEQPSRASAIAALGSDPQTAERLRQLQTAAEAAERAHDLAIRQERSAWQDYQSQAQIQWEPAAVQPAVAPRSMTTTVLASLLAGLALAAGVGMISGGIRIEPTVQTADELKAALPDGLIATVPAVDPTSNAAAGHWRPATRLALIFAGAVLIAGCLGSFVMALSGF